MQSRSRVAAVLLMIVAGTLASVAAEPAPSAADRVILKRCLVALVDEARVPAEEAGVLVSFKVREGAQVERGQSLAQVHDALSRLERDVAVAESAVARAKAANDANVRYAQVTNEVAKAELDMNVEANRKQPGTKSQVEMNKLALVVQQSGLQIEQAQRELGIAEHEAQAAVAKVAIAEEHLVRRELRAPFPGEVVELLVHAGEWVEPGQPVLRLVRLDHLRVEGFLAAGEYLPADIQDRPVEVSVQLPGGRTEILSGKITFVSPLVEAGGDWRVWAEIANRQQRGQWLLRPGLEVDMSILPLADGAAAPAIDVPAAIPSP